MLLLNWNNRNSKSQMSLQSQVWHGAQFPLLKFNLLLFTNPILWKNAQFKCKCNLHRGADSRFAVSIANEPFAKGEINASEDQQLPGCSLCHLPFSCDFLLKPPASELQVGRQKGVENWGIFPDISSCIDFFLSCIDYWLENKRSFGFSELLLWYRCWNH